MMTYSDLGIDPKGKTDEELFKEIEHKLDTDPKFRAKVFIQMGKGGLIDKLFEDMASSFRYK